ncbi:MAG: IS3 family transposase [Bacteroidetes bacterium]|nr:IS3 family transposase [Bacteroidota bacterium]
MLLKKGPPRPTYSEDFKRRVVKEFEQGKLNKDQLMVKYGIKGKSVVLAWCRKYGKFVYNTPAQNGRPVKDPHKKIKELEKKLKAAELKLKVYDKLIEVTNRELDADIIKKIGGQVVRELAAQKGISLSGVCRQLGYSKQAYYKSLYRQKIKKDFREQVKEKVLSVRHVLPQLGTRKLYHLLEGDFKRHGMRVGRDKLFTLLREESMLVVRKRKYVRTTDSRLWMRQYPDLAKGLTPSRPEQLWVADITYLATRQRCCYLHLITDAYSKKIMGYKLGEHLGTSVTMQALTMALEQRKYNKPLVHHSDRGLQYCSKEYTSMLKDNNITISMTQTGSPYDNAVAERVNGILKQELGLDEQFESAHHAQKQVHQAVVLYNRFRPHFSNHLLTPEQMHHQKRLKPRTWKRKTTGFSVETSGLLPSNQFI